jgi:hypothetical protein
MTRFKDATFESGALTGTDALTSNTSGTLDSTSKIKGTYCYRTNWATAVNVNGAITGLSLSESYNSFYFNVAAVQSSGSPRIYTQSNGATQINFTISTARVVSVRMGGTTLGTLFTPALNTTYRIGVYFKVSSSAAAADAIVRVYVATGDAAFSGTPTYENTAVTMATSNAVIGSFTFGQNNASGNSGDYFWDDIRVDDSSMPGPSVVITHLVKLDKWRWYSDAATDAGLTALAAENTAPTLSTAAYMQGITVLRLRLQLKEQNAGAGSGVIQLQYSGDGVTFQDVGDNPIGSTQAGYLAAWGSGAATHLGTITTRFLTGSTESGTYRESTSVTAESIGASAVHELDVAIILRYPPPASALYFRVFYGGAAVDAVTTYPNLTTASIATRGQTVDKLASQSGGFGAGELFRPQYNRLIWDGSLFWAFVPDPAGTTTLKYYSWDGQASSAWSAASTVTFTGPMTGAKMFFAYGLVGASKVVYAYYYRSGDFYQRRGIISGTSISWQVENSLTASSWVGYGLPGFHHAALDSNNRLITAVIDNSFNGISVIKSTAADDGTGTFFPTYSGATAAQVADPDGSTSTSSGGIQVVSLGGGNSLIVWQNLGNLKAVKYTGASNTLGTVQVINSAHATDWYAVKQGSYVYIVYNTGSGSLAMLAYSIAGDTYTVTTTAASMTINQGDGVALVPGATDEVYIISTFVGSLGGTDRVLKYKKYTGPAHGGSYGALTTITTSSGRGKGRFVAGQQAAATSARVALLWEFGEDTITSTPFSLEYHGINLFNAFSQIITATTAPARSMYKKPIKAILRSGAPARSVYKKAIKALLKNSDTSHWQYAKVTKTILRTESPVKSIKKIGSFIRKATSAPLARPQKNVKPLPKLVSTTGLASSTRKLVQVIIALAHVSGVASMRRIVTLYKKVTTGLKRLLKTVKPLPKVAQATALGVVRKVVSKPLGALSQLAPSARRVVWLYRKATSDQAIKSIRKVVSKSLSRAGTVAPTIRKGAYKPIHVVLGHVQSLGKAISKLMELSSAVQSPIRKIITKIRLTTSTGTAARRLHATLIRRATSTLAAALRRVFGITLTAGAWFSPTRSKHVRKYVGATQYGLSYSQRRIGKTISRAGTAAAASQRRITKAIRVSSAALGSLLKHRIVTVIMLVALSPLPRRIAQIVKGIKVATGTPRLLKIAVKRLTVDGLLTPKAPVKSVVKRLTRLTTAQTTGHKLITAHRLTTAHLTAAPLKIVRKTFTAIAGKTASIRRNTIKYLLTHSAAAGNAQRRITKAIRPMLFIYGDARKQLHKTLGGAISTGAGKITKGTLKRLSTSLGASGRLQKNARKALLAYSFELPRMQRRATLILRRVVSSTTVLVKWRTITRIIQATSAGAAGMLKLASKTLQALSNPAPIVRKQARKTLHVVRAGLASSRRTTSKRLHATSTGAAIPQKLVRLYRVAHATLHATLYKNPIKYIRAAASGSIGRRLHVLLHIQRAATHLGSIQKHAKRTISAVAPSASKIILGIPQAMSTSIAGALAGINRAVVSFGVWRNRRAASMDDKNTEGEG